MNEIQIDRLLRSKRRRSVQLEVTINGELTVRAPQYVSSEEIERIILEKRNWILEKQNFFHQYKIDPAKRFMNGGSYYYLGQLYSLKLTDGNNICLTDYLEFPRSMLPNARDNLVHWYKIRAYERIKERIEFYSKIFGSSYSDIEISYGKKLAGSCRSDGCLSFTWRLIMAPLEIIDYVVVHELVHLEVKNHSSKFWNKVGAVLPDYEKRRKMISNLRFMDPYKKFLWIL